jgi:uncharacterized lipoprotein YmbA
MRVLRALLVGWTILGAGGCGLNFDPQPNPTRYFLMQAAYDEPVGDTGSLQGLTLGVGPVRFAPYLRQDRLVTRVQKTEVDLARYERWAEPFHEHFVRILGQDLENRTRPERMAEYPWVGLASVDFSVEVFVWRFDRLPDGSVELEADWHVFDGDRLRRSRADVLIRQPAVATGPDGSVLTEDSVEAMSEAVSQLSAQIAQALESAAAGR